MRLLQPLLFILVLVPANLIIANTITPTEQPDKSRYYLDEPVVVYFSLCNNTDQVAWIDVGMCCIESAFEIEILNASGAVVATYDPGILCLAIGCSFSWDPFECKSREIPWDQADERFPEFEILIRPQGEQVPPGMYRIRFSWNGDVPPVYSDWFEVLGKQQQANSIPTLSTVGSALLVLLISSVGVLSFRTSRENSVPSSLDAPRRPHPPAAGEEADGE